MRSLVIVTCPFDRGNRSRYLIGTSLPRQKAFLVQSRKIRRGRRESQGPYRVLKPSGNAEIIVPDLPWCMKQWLRLPDSARWEWALDTNFGLQDHPGEFHKTGFSVDRLNHLLTEAGFQRIHISTRFDHGMRSIRAVASSAGEITATKPHTAARWVRKHLVFLFYRLATYLSPAS